MRCNVRWLFVLFLLVTLNAPSIAQSSATPKSEPVASTHQSVTSEPQDVLSTAASNESLGIFVAALRTSGLAQVLKEDGSFTLFALDVQAFASLPPADLRVLLQQPAAMHLFLANYLVKENLPSNSAGTWAAVRTAGGRNLRTEIREDGVFVNTAKLKDIEIPCTNGTIHILHSIDPVLAHEAVMAVVGRTK